MDTNQKECKKCGNKFDAISGDKICDSCLESITYRLDGNMTQAIFPDFDCLMTSPSGFGETEELAKQDLLKNII